MSQPTLAETTTPASSANGSVVSVKNTSVNGGNIVTRQSLWSAKRGSSAVKNWWCISVWRT